MRFLALVQLPQRSRWSRIGGSWSRRTSVKSKSCHPTCYPPSVLLWTPAAQVQVCHCSSRLATCLLNLTETTVSPRPCCRTQARRTSPAIKVKASCNFWPFGSQRASPQELWPRTRPLASPLRRRCKASAASRRRCLFGSSGSCWSVANPPAQSRHSGKLARMPCSSLFERRTSRSSWRICWRPVSAKVLAARIGWPRRRS
mmetsp:Transcript_19911/g.43235  ORF Transcript_19911/g.43235 Transcript_19911/m.43235 type:complete len:201 (+) Transcript_19911:2912-3514(+)